MSDFRIKTCTVGQVATNCYIVYKEGGEKAVIVDPGDNGAHLLNRCRELMVTPEAIVLTHGHFDHILAVEDLRRAFPDIKVYAGAEETRLLADPALNLSISFGTSASLKADVLVREGEILSLAGMNWKVIFTPGHTEGSVCYYIEEEGVLLSGDTLFAQSCGRTDFPTGNTSALLSSIVDKLFLLPDDTMVYAGHESGTTIGHEKVYNPVANYRR